MSSGARRGGCERLCQDIVELRREDHYAERLRLDLERFADASRADEERALEITLDESKQWPDVVQAFKGAFALLKQRKTGKPATPNRPDQTKSN